MINIRIDDRAFRAATKKLAKMFDGAEKTIEECTHKALDQMRPKAEAMINAKYNISASGQLSVEKYPMGGAIRASGGMLEVSQFAPQVEGQAVSVEIKRGNRVVIGPGAIGRGAFYAKGRIFERRQDEKYPIYPVWTIGLPQMLYSKSISDPIREETSEIALQLMVARLIKL